MFVLIKDKQVYGSKWDYRFQSYYESSDVTVMVHHICIIFPLLLETDFTHHIFRFYFTLILFQSQVAIHELAFKAGKVDCLQTLK